LRTTGCHRSSATRAATGPELDALGVAVPCRRRSTPSCATPRRARARVPACYLDLGNFPVEVEGGGQLIHFLSDQQWVRHWLLYADEHGNEAVVSTADPYRFDLGDEDFEVEAPSRFEPGAADAVICAGSFKDFLYRFWIENEIWFALSEKRELTPEQRAYAEHYR
jgi:hypothetical protein